MRQVGVELQRFFARRMTRWFMILGALLIVVTIAIATFNGKVRHSTETYYNGIGTPITSPTGEIVGFEPGDDHPVTETVVSDNRVKVGQQLRETLTGSGLAMVFVALALGASFVGAEFNVGSLTSQLLFEPRRWLMHIAKALAVAIGAGLVWLLLAVLISGSLWAGSELHGVVRGLDSDWWFGRMGDALRVAGAVALAAMMAYGVTLVAKRSMATVIVFFIQFPVLFMIQPNRKIFGVLSKYAPMRALITVVFDPRRSTFFETWGIRTLAGGVVLLCVWAAANFLVTGRVFARSEIR